MNTTQEYTIGQLAHHAGVTTRTIRYYVSKGLLPVPVTCGRYARYTLSHLQRLQLIRRLQQAFLPLAEIRTRLATMTDRDIEQWLTHPPSSDRPLHVPREKDGMSMSPAPALPLHPLPTTIEFQAAAMPQPGPPPMVNLSMNPSISAPLQPGYAAVYVDDQNTDAPAEATWRRIVLAPGIELHLREPHDPERDQQIAALRQHAQELFTDR